MKIERLKLEDTSFDGRDNYWYYHPLFCQFVEGRYAIFGLKKDKIRGLIKTELIEAPEWMVIQIKEKLISIETCITALKDELEKKEIECKRLKGVLS